MADSVDVKLTGVENAVSNVQRILAATPTAVMSGVKRVGLMIERDAKGHCPVDTGRLRASISTNWTGSGMTHGEVDSKANADDGVNQPPERPDTFLLHNGTNVEYAWHVEMNSAVKHESGTAHFLYASYFKNEKNVKQEIAREWGKELAKAIKKGVK